MVLSYYFTKPPAVTTPKPPEPGYQGDENDKKCFSCQSSALVLDWKQGDLICTDCGVVNEDRIQDTKHEWTDFNDVEDIVKGLPSSARCGLIPNDESRYVGGLQPTCLSKVPFGGAYSGNLNPAISSSAHAEKRLKRTHRIIEKMVESKHTKQIKEAEIARKILLKRSKTRNKNGTNGSQKYYDLASEKLESLQESASSISSHSALMHDKWSLERALLLYGTNDEAITALSKALSLNTPNAIHQNTDRMIEMERKLVLTRVEKSDRIASRDLYQAYTFLSKTVQQMKLPSSLFQECVRYMCQFVTKKNGFHVKGIIARDVSNEKDGMMSGCSTEQRRKKKLQEDCKRELNKEKQMISLVAALIYVTAKKHGVGRSLKDLCIIFESRQSKSTSSFRSPKKSNSISIKPKMLSKAVTELKSEIPQLFESLGNPSLDAANLVQHIGEKLQLPSAAIGSIRTLAIHCGKEQMENGFGSGSRPSVVCAGVTYLVCRAASVMQRLAKQALLDAEMGRTSVNSFEVKQLDDILIPTVSSSKKRSCHDNHVDIDKRQSTKKIKIKKDPETKHSKSAAQVKKEQSETVINSQAEFQSPDVEQMISNTEIQTMKKECNISAEIEDNHDEISKLPMKIKSSDFNVEDESSMGKTPLSANTSTHFDALSSEPIIHSHSNKELEVLQGWFSWSNQSSWSRELSEIASACDVTNKVALEYYKKFLHPRRSRLLPIVQEYLKSCDDADVCYLVNITSAAPLMILGQL